MNLIALEGKYNTSCLLTFIFTLTSQRGYKFCDVGVK
jgi:hypothetical protein